MSTATESKKRVINEDDIIYEVPLDAGDLSEAVNVNETLEVIRGHLDAAARTGRGMEIVLLRL